MLSCIVLLVIFAVHFNRAMKNITEKEREVYLRKSNPFDFGFKSNMHEYFYKYTKSPSNIFDNSKSFYLDEPSYYFAILSRYGKVVYTKTGLDIQDLYSKFTKTNDRNDGNLPDPFESKISPRGVSVPKNLDSLFMHRMSYKPAKLRTSEL
jgi:hypothetical protein